MIYIISFAENETFNSFNSKIIDDSGNACCAISSLPDSCTTKLLPSREPSLQTTMSAVLDSAGMNFLHGQLVDKHAI